MKQSDELYKMNDTATPPLLPVVPPKPVLVVWIEMSLTNGASVDLMKTNRQMPTSCSLAN